jgi:hypothetical protein
LLALAVLFAYHPGLNGPFLFDDHVHITQNRWVKIDSLAPHDLERAWNSSFSTFPANRPLAQLSFGVNHAISGLDPWAFKATNLALHLGNGLLAFLFCRLALQALRRDDGRTDIANWVALAATAVWLLHPLQVSTVLYTVQRMAQLSTLSLLLALCLYLWGRMRIAQGHGGMVPIILAVPVSAIGFLAKENTVLLPLLLLVCELTLLRNTGFGPSILTRRTVWGLLIVAPLLGGLLYLMMHPGMLSHEGRTFTLEDRLLTQPRVLWFYLKLLFIPDITAFALFHDAFRVSNGLLQPATTLVAGAGLAVLALFAWLQRARYPLFAFAVGFFLANHALESTVLPLEMVFEHRNYLAILGPVLWLVHLILTAASGTKLRPAALGLGALLLASYVTVTVIRVGYWSSYQKFVLATAERHPDSPRASFMAGQFLLAAAKHAEGDKTQLADAARTMFENGLEVNDRCINCLFGLLVLDLTLDRDPSTELLARLKNSLRSGEVGPTTVAVNQFSFLSRWQRGGGHRLSRDDFQALFDAALENSRWTHTARAGIAAAYAEYYEFVVKDLDAARTQARAAVDAWPQQWAYHIHLVRILRKLGQYEQALATVRNSLTAVSNDDQKRESEKLIGEIDREMSER